MKNFKRLNLIIGIIIGSFVITSLPSCDKTKGSTEKRIKKQKKRQKRNPNDCPRIDC